MGRATQGVRLINLDKRNDEIASVCKVNSEDLEDNETNELNDGDDSKNIAK
jgi:DNA gyrase subunit A